MPKQITEKNLVTYIMRYESGEITYDEYFSLFGYLIRTKKAWSLQGMYGREASNLIKSGLINRKGEVQWKEIKKSKIQLNKPMYA